MRKQWKQCESVESESYCFGGAAKITADGDCSHEIKRHLLLGRTVMTQPRQQVKKQRHYFADRGLSIQGYGFSSSHVWMWELDYKESWAPENWCFWTVVLEKTLESSLDCKEIQPVHPKGSQSWILEGLMLKLKLQYFGHIMQRTDSFEKTLMQFIGSQKVGQTERLNRTDTFPLILYYTFPLLTQLHMPTSLVFTLYFLLFIACQSSFLFLLFMYLLAASCRILVYWPGIKLCPLLWKHRVLTTGLPGKSQLLFLFFFFLERNCKCLVPWLPVSSVHLDYKLYIPGPPLPCIFIFFRTAHGTQGNSYLQVPILSYNKGWNKEHR